MTGTTTSAARAPASAPGGAPRRRSPLLLIFAPVPGLGHWVVNRAARGLLTFMAFAAGMNVVLLSAIWAPGRSFSPVWGWVLAGAAVLFSLVDVTRLVFGGR